MRLDRGFVQHGHLFGCPAIIVPVGPDHPTPDVGWVKRNLRAGEHVHVFVQRGSSEEGSSVVNDLIDSGVLNLSCCTRMGESVCHDRVLYNSCVRILEEDCCHFDPALIDPRVGSISVHAWPGSGISKAIDDFDGARLGKLFILEGTDADAAKVWIRGKSKSAWRLLRTSNLDEISALDLEEMMALP